MVAKAAHMERERERERVTGARVLRRLADYEVAVESVYWSGGGGRETEVTYSINHTATRVDANRFFLLLLKTVVLQYKEIRVKLHEINKKKHLFEFM